MGMDISKQAIINVSADRLWSILADDFDKIGEWARGVDSSAVNLDAAIPEGATIGGRVCQAPGFGAINETFTRFDPAKRSYAFQATASKIPSFVENLTNHTSVRAVGPERSEVRLRITADTQGVMGKLMGPMMSRKFGSAIDGVLEDLEAYAESGEISAEKAKALAKAGR